MSKSSNGTGASAGARRCARMEYKSALQMAPRLVTTGRKFHDSVPAEDCAHVDWIAFSVRPGESVTSDRAPQWIAATLADPFGLQGAALQVKKGGWNGYKYRLDILDASGTLLGLAAFGGESQRGSLFVSLDGKGCSAIADWERVRNWGGKSNAKIKRIDLAHDDFNGESVNVAKAVEWYRGGAFTSGGRPPAVSCIDDLDSGKGKTLYVGARENGKMCRVYEKGRQLGDPLSPWVRCEVELHGTDRWVPWEAVVRPGDFFAGAYPCLRDFAQTPERVRTIKKASEIEYGAMTGWVNHAAGSALYAMLIVEGSPQAVMLKAAGNKVPKRLRSYPAFKQQAASGEGA